MDKTLIIMPAYNVAGQINKLLDEMGRYRERLLGRKQRNVIFINSDGQHDWLLHIMKKILIYAVE